MTRRPRQAADPRVPAADQQEERKSTIAAGIMVTALIRNWRHSAELLIIAPTLRSRTTASSRRRAWSAPIPSSRAAARRRAPAADPAPGDRAELKVIAADSETVGGKKAGFVLVEELWLFGKKRRRRGDAARGDRRPGGAPEGFVIYLTTHSDEPPAGVFKSKLEYARDVRDGVIETRRSCRCCTNGRSDARGRGLSRPGEFLRHQPERSGRSVSAELARGRARKEQRGEGEGLQIFLAKHLNVEIGCGCGATAGAAPTIWEAAGDRTLTLEALLERCEVVVVGGDGGGLDDLYGLCVAGREKGTDRWLYWSKAWCWPEVLERARRSRRC
jgi:phage terminase large subunit-like protein